MARILLTHTPGERALYYGDEAVRRLRLLGDVATLDATSTRSLDALVAAARGCDVIVSYRSTAAPAALFAELPDLVAFVRCAVDIRNIDVAAASAHGIAVTQASAGFAAAVAEWAVGAMVDLARGITASTLAFRAGEPPAIGLGTQLRGATLGLVGYGRIARELAPVAHALGMTVLANDPNATADNELAVRMCEFDELLKRSDFVVCLAPATPGTENLFDAAAFARMKRGAFFLNPSRGELVDEAALLHALDTGGLAGCAMDVGRAPDQMPTPALARHPKVLATPHTGGLTRPAIEHQAFETVAQVELLLRGTAPIGCVNAAQASRLRAPARG